MSSVRTNAGAGGIIEELEQKLAATDQSLSDIYIQSVVVEAAPLTVFQNLSHAGDLGFLTKTNHSPDYWETCLKPCELILFKGITSKWKHYFEKGDGSGNVLESSTIHEYSNGKILTLHKILEPGYQYRLKGVSSATYNTSYIMYFILPV